jgi:flagellar biosynthesis protein FlhF
MRLKLFRAATMAEAMARARAELGAEAIILGTRRVAEGIELTAALEAADEPVLIPPLPPHSGAAAAAAPADGAGLLGAHNLPAALAARLAGGGLEDALSRVLRFAPLPCGAPRPLLLAGPPGAGKTLTCAKLATRCVLAGGVPPPLVVTTDGQRAGAAEQLAAFTRVLGVTLAVATGPGPLAKALMRRAPGAPVLIDTAGCDPFDPVQAEALRAIALVAEAEVALVLPAGLDPHESADLARAFADLGARHLVPTRLDTARRLGSVLAAAAGAPLALGEGGTGPGAADGLTALSPASLAERLRAAADRLQQEALAA